MTKPHLHAARTSLQIARFSPAGAPPRGQTRVRPRGGAIAARGDRAEAPILPAVDVELDPEQPDEIVDAIADLLDEHAEPDPWWQAGLDDALGEA